MIRPWPKKKQLFPRPFFPTKDCQLRGQQLEKVFLHPFLLQKHNYFNLLTSFPKFWERSFPH
jgi:hypothetical protein